MPKTLVLEVTEETSLANLPNITANIERFGVCGIVLAIDDFSMGADLLNYLRNNPLPLCLRSSTGAWSSRCWRTAAPVRLSAPSPPWETAWGFRSSRNLSSRGHPGRAAGLGVHHVPGVSVQPRRPPGGAASCAAGGVDG